ncbi:MAG: acetyl-CoA C-acetyltransferase [Propionibacteriaceae bacterium]|nr:acetyl-CoA C-acetyltransferase [Propionibacteriaceae bacterium]
MTPSGDAMTRSAVIVGGNRTPFVKAGTSFAAASNSDLLTAALDGLAARFGLAGRRLDEVAGGAVLKHSRDFNLTREAVMGSALDPTTPAVDLQQACATGVETVVYIANKIALGQADVGVGAGVDSASDAPITITEPLRRALLRANRARSLPERLRALATIRPHHLAPVAPQVVEPRTGLSMGEHQAVTTAKWEITRQAQDELALASHRNLAAAWDSGFFGDLVTGYLGVNRDGLLRPDTSLEKLAVLKPAFGGPDGTMTAGNSTPLTDGAAAVLLAEEGWAEANGLPRLARLVDAQVAAVDHTSGDDLLLAPTDAAARLLERQGMALGDFELYELHEAFAATVLATLAKWEKSGLGTIDTDRMNVTGSSLAAGHPFAATGGRIVATLAKLLHARGSGARGLVSVCAAGGQGIVAILEAV